MKRKFSLILILFFSSICYSQGIEYQKVVNALILGLEEKAITLGHEIISDKSDKDREHILKLLGDHFLYKSLNAEENELLIARRAATLYKILTDEYPESEYLEIVKYQLNMLRSIFKNLELYNYLFNDLYGKAVIVEKLFDIGQIYNKLEDETPIIAFDLFYDTDSKFQIANKYYDSIILNQPDFEAYGYYLKVISFLNNHNRWAFTDWKKNAGIESKLNGYDATVEIIENIFHTLDEKHPSSTYTLELHFLYAGILWNSTHFNLKPNKKREAVKPHMEKILENDLDKLGLRYVLTKEFVIRNF